MPRDGPITNCHFFRVLLYFDTSVPRQDLDWFMTVYGRKCMLPIDIILSTWQIVQDYEKQLPMTTKELVDFRIEQLGQNHCIKDAAIKNLKASRLKNNEYFDKNKSLNSETAIISEKDLFLLHDTKLENQHTNKLADNWDGPYIVHKILDGGAYVLTDLYGTELGAYAGNRLKNYWQRNEEEKNQKGNEKGLNTFYCDDDDKPSAQSSK